MQVARQLLRDGVDNLARQDVSQLARVRGVGLAKATRIAASFELARRCRRPTRRAFELNEFGEKLVASWGHHRQERLGAALLDGRHQVFRQRLIFVGTVNYTIVSTRDILQFAILQQATAVVVYHNHPSGNTGPSPEDVEFTKKLDEALKLVDIELRDHLIIGAHTFSSMKQKHYF